ncbi:M20 family metallo-hydrolase [Tuberibacillus sp. Marseille-P3662]|uniref:M20 family metallo-hydrolase n=1 Tax=Tuberibacillus sp. Marseille-P3662 TaxID=1965358 RepID=UPI000A1C9BDB|nr:M20 family metallo-hydrolase [Tuberibacillus sp. Marseille-P3662]
MSINRERLQSHLEQLSQIGKIGETGVRRLAHSEEDREAVEVVRGWMAEAGLKARIDNFGNLIGKLEGKNPDAPVLMIGSHIDSQPYGGRFDGTAGALGALEVAQTMMEQGIQSKIPVEVICFADEEGSRFGKGTFGSRGITDQLETGEIERKDKNGVSRRQALESFGCNPDDMERSEYSEGDIQAFIELHIEQGPVLEKKEIPVGIVSGISGPLWMTVSFEGFAGHAGSVPMNLRQDALVGSSEVISQFDNIVKQDPNASTVGTVGSLHVFPDSRNIIPEKVEFTIDLRDIDINRRNQYENELMKVVKTTAEKYQLTYSIREDMRNDPSYCNHSIKEMMRIESEEMGLDAPELMSGPFHDALSLSQVCDYGMIFVRCKDGISHNPAEYASYQDIAEGVELMYRTAVRIVQDEIRH